MPKVMKNGKVQNFPYTAKGKRAAKAAAMQAKKAKKGKKG